MCINFLDARANVNWYNGQGGGGRASDNAKKRRDEDKKNGRNLTAALGFVSFSKPELAKKSLFCNAPRRLERAIRESALQSTVQLRRG